MVVRAISAADEITGWEMRTELIRAQYVAPLWVNQLR
ncbi:Uncharacterised protein [Serratia grimesii]|nr:Uncharacterised protein [Serratia grimesii]